MNEFVSEEIGLIRRRKKALSVSEQYSILYENGTLARIVYNILKTYNLNCEEKEDIVSEICIKAYKKINDYKQQENGSFITWFYVVAVNYMKDYFKSLYTRDKNGNIVLRRQTVSMINSEGEEIEIVDDYENVEETVQTREENHFFYKLISSLPPDKQLLIDLIIGNYDTDYVIKKLGIDKEATLRKRVHDLKIKLAKQYLFYTISSKAIKKDGQKLIINKSEIQDNEIDKNILAILVKEIDFV